MALPASLLAQALPHPANAATIPPSLCAPGETVLFDCQLAGRAERVSVCAHGDLGTPDGTLQYRFGTPAAITLRYPSAPAGSVAHFSYSAYLRGGGPGNAGLDLFSLVFHQSADRYEVFSDFSAEDNSESQGVRIQGTQEAEWACEQPVTDQLRAASLEQVLRAEPETDE